MGNAQTSRPMQGLRNAAVHLTKWELLAAQGLRHNAAAESQPHGYLTSWEARRQLASRYAAIPSRSESTAFSPWELRHANVGPALSASKIPGATAWEQQSAAPAPSIPPHQPMEALNERWELDRAAELASSSLSETVNSFDGGFTSWEVQAQAGKVNHAAATMALRRSLDDITEIANRQHIVIAKLMEKYGERILQLPQDEVSVAVRTEQATQTGIAAPAMA